ncbi:phage antirepressor KilAC domain-containing protein [Megasphaera sp.]|uniref:phage antirepressor KilAC domain-containing protein n=1 Tax=Megasphaera sp. TaxID=2023260 RepID=UPI00351F9843
MNEVLSINNVRGYLDKETGTAYLNAEDVARGFGFIQRQNKGGKEYVSIRWSTVNSYLHSFGFPQNVGENDFLPENMVYRLGFKASNEVAQKFQAVLADEVLPAIRKHGAYMTSETIEKALLTPDFLIKLATELKTEQEKNKKLQEVTTAQHDELTTLRPKGIFADAVDASDTAILVGELAKIIKQNGVDIGQNRLFKWMRENGFLIKSGAQKNMPTQKSMNLGLFEIKERNVANPNGSIMIVKTTKVTGKGQIYFVNLFLKKEARA